MGDLATGNKELQQVMDASKVLQRISRAHAAGQIRLPEGEKAANEFPMRLLQITRYIGDGDMDRALPELAQLERDLTEFGYQQ